MLDDARLALADGLTHDPPEIVAGATELLADVLFERGHPGEAQQRYEAAAVLSSDAAEKCRLLRLAAGAAAGRNVGGESVDLLIRAAGVARAAGDRSGAARDLAAAAALQFRAGGIMRRLVETAIVDDLLDQAGALSGGDAHAEAAIAVARGWRPGATTLGRTHTEHALDLATGVGDRLLVDEALDQLMAVAMAERQLAAAADLAIRRLDALEEVRIDATSSFEHYDARHMACHLMLATGQLVEARRYADAIAALPCFREQRHIGLGRRMEVDAVAGHFDAVLDAAVLFERDWRRAGSPIARNLAVGAYATAAVHSMLGDADGAQHWTSITRALVPAVEDFHPGLWRLTFDALVALHHDDAATAMSLLQPPDELVAGTDPHRSLWLPWHVALWAEASVLTHRVDATERTAHARRWVLGNRLAELIIDRAEVLHNGRSERLDALATEFAERGCDYQSARTRELGTWERRT